MTEPNVYAFDHFATTEADERWLSEVEVDFTAFDAVQFAASLEAVVLGSRGTFRVRMGGTSKSADGTQLLLLDVGQTSSWVEMIDVIPRMVTRGMQLFKLTAQVDVQDTIVEINAGSMTLWAESIEVPLVLKIMGTDIHLGDDGEGNPDYSVTPARDWKLVSGREAYKQSLRRRFITSKGEYKTKPDYGGDLLSLVKRRDRSANRDQAANNLRAQAMADERTKEVVSIKVEPLGTFGIKYSVVVRMKGGDGSLVTIEDSIGEDLGT